MKQFSKTNLPQWQLDLINKYPLIFTEEDKEAAEWYRQENPSKHGFLSDDYCNLRFGFEHDEGWGGLIEEYAQTATTLINDIRYKIYQDYKQEYYIHSFIIKEKFGELTIQGNINLPEPYNKLWRAFEIDIEKQSRRICEITGKHGRIVSRNGCIKCLCKEKAEELGYK